MLSRSSFHGLGAILVFDNWPMLVLERLCDRKTGLVVYRKKGFDILIDHRGGDQCGTRMCIATDMYRKYLPHFNLQGPVRVLDLGANGGGFPLMLRIEGIEVARAVCVEMNPLTYQRLQLNLATNLGLSAVAINAAVSAMPEGSEIPVLPSRGGTGVSLANNRTETSESHVSVPTTTLQALCDRHFKDELVDICKIDIEGEEYELFESAPDKLLLQIRHLILEMHYFQETSRARGQALIARLTGLGFTDITIEEGHETNPYGEVRAFAGPAAKAASVEGLVAA
jgi:FkbM family methyltransferase